jgi:uncharacterized protein DUF6636
MMLAVRAIAFAALVVVLTPSAAPASTVISFRTPSGNIGCVYASGLGPAPSLRCDIRSGLRPRPPRPRGCDLDWGDSYDLGRTGRATVTCHGDTAILPRARVLRYGSSWTRSGFVCTSRVSGLRCRNASDHGFFLSKQRSYRF